MSVAEVVGQIGEIRSRLALLVPRSTSADSGASFATALSSVNAPAATAATAATSGATATGTGVTGDDVLAAARRYEGVPYVLGGESRSGMDCSGLVQTAFKDLGVDVPRLVHEQQTIGQQVASLKDAQPGDLVVLAGGDHIAIWAGDGKAVHAPYPGRTVTEQKAWFDDSDVVTIRRVVPATADALAAGAAPLAASAGPAGASPAALAQSTALLGMYGGSSAGASGSPSVTAASTADPLSAMLGTAGSTGSSSTAQQLLAARARLLGSAA